MMKLAAFLFLCLCMSSFAHADCLSDLKSQIDSAPKYEQREAIIRALDASDLKCIYEAVAAAAGSADAKPVTLTEFYPEDRTHNRVEKFFGKSSLPVSKYFEKHFFYINQDGARKLYGYNYSPGTNWFTGPGFLSVEVAPSGKYFEGDYTKDFVKEIPADQFSKLEGRTIRKIRNNDTSLAYGNLVDRFYRVTNDVYMNEGLNPVQHGKKKGQLKHLVYFILLRK